jgi:hypothetical protein
MALFASKEAQTLTNYSVNATYKSIGSILLIKNGMKYFCRKYKNHVRSHNYEVCTAVARCFPNILDAMVLENIKMS